MFEGIRSLLGFRPRRSQLEEKLDRALESAEALDHYFFFPDEPHADTAAQRLAQRGWSIVSISLYAGRRKWLLQARQPGRVEDLKELQTELDLLADELHGEYDGWQVPGITENL
jgi:regulator of ribonuclease activity B